MNLSKNQLVELEITGFTAEGSGVGRAEEIAVFVPGAALGDRLLVRILKPAKSYAFGKIEQILVPSPDRIPLDCSVATQCGGCVFRHIRYSAEKRAKEQRIHDAMERIGGFQNLNIRPIVGAEQLDHYRNKAQFPVGINADGVPVLGFYATHSHRIVPCQKCFLQPDVFEYAAQAFLTWLKETGDSVYEEKSGKGRIRHLYLRYAQETGEVMVCIVVNGNGVHREDRFVQLLREKVPGLKSVVINQNRENTNVIMGKKCRTVWGSGTIRDRLCGLWFEISPQSFYQVNHDQAERLYRIAADYAGLSGNEILLDLYCGTGTIGLSMAKQARRLIGVEIVQQAVENARRNAEDNNIGNAEFLCMDAAKAAAMLAERGTLPDVVVVDPPRKGCGQDLIQTIIRMQPERVVYVSCDPATLARDLRSFAEQGYWPQELTPVDMFPRTAHVECVVLMSKVKE